VEEPAVVDQKKDNKKDVKKDTKLNKQQQ